MKKATGGTSKLENYFSPAANTTTSAATKDKK
jgi:hypothetical protein